MVWWVFLALPPAVCDHLEIKTFDALVGIGERAGHIGERADLAFGARLIENVEDRAGQEGVARLCPMIDEAFSFRVDEDGHEVLDIANLVKAAQPDLLKRVEADTAGGGARIEFHDGIAGFLFPPCRRQVPELGFLIVDDNAMGPGEKRRHDKPNAFARSRRRDGGDMLRAVVAQITKPFAFVAPAANIDAFTAPSLFRQKPRRLDFSLARPMSGPVNAFVAFRVAPAEREQAEQAARKARAPCRPRRSGTRCGPGRQTCAARSATPRANRDGPQEARQERDDRRTLTRHTASPRC